MEEIKAWFHTQCKHALTEWVKTPTRRRKKARSVAGRGEARRGALPSGVVVLAPLAHIAQTVIQAQECPASEHRIAFHAAERIDKEPAPAQHDDNAQAGDLA